MGIRKDIRRNPSDQTAYGYYNYGSLFGITSLKRDAKKEVEKLAGKPWDEAKAYFEIHKVVVKKIPVNKKEGK